MFSNSGGQGRLRGSSSVGGGGGGGGGTVFTLILST